MDIVVLILVISLTILLIGNQKISLKDKTTLKQLYFLHLLFGAYYCFFLKGDANWYWMFPKTFDLEKTLGFFQNETGTYFVYALNYFPSKVLDLSYFTGTMIYSTIGFIGIVNFYKIAIEYIPYNSKAFKIKLFPLLFFFPSLHIWSCAVGKDTLLFASIGVYFYGICNFKKRMPAIIIALLIAYLVRPHMALFMAISLGITYFSGRRVPFYQKIILSGVGVLLIILILPKVLESSKIEELNADNLEKFSDTRVHLLSRSAGSAVDISSYPFPLKVFTFLYRPLFFDINGIPALLASFENIFFLLLSFLVIKNKFKKTYQEAPTIIKSLFIFLCIGATAFSQVLGNLGIMIRMRNMFLPGMMIYILWALSYQQQLKYKK